MKNNEKVMRNKSDVIEAVFIDIAAAAACACTVLVVLYAAVAHSLASVVSDDLAATEAVKLNFYLKKFCADFLFFHTHYVLSVKSYANSE